MNSVVECRATTAARTGRPDRVALSVILCVCVFVQAGVSEESVCLCGMVKACLFI